MLQNQELKSTEMTPASALNLFEQTVNTMEPQGKPVEFNQPRLSQAAPTPPPPPPRAMKDAVAMLEAEAIHDGPEFQIYTRYAWHQGEIFIDLGDADRTQIRITKGGCFTISSKDSPVKFCWNQGKAPLPVPNFQGSIDQLRQFLNLENESDWIMLVS